VASPDSAQRSDATGNDATRAGLALRLVIFGGEVLDTARLAPWYERHPGDAPRLVNIYGITETTVHVTHLPLDASSAPADRPSTPSAPSPWPGNRAWPPSPPSPPSP
jgi:non-ribosomal peptide synthetase component F